MPGAVPGTACLPQPAASPGHHGPGWSHSEVGSNFWRWQWLSLFLRSLLFRIMRFRLGYEPAAGKRCIWGLISFIDYFTVQILQGASSPWDRYPCVGKTEINKSIQKNNFILPLNQKLRYTHFSLPSPPWLKYILCYISNCFEPL